MAFVGNLMRLMLLGLPPLLGAGLHFGKGDGGGSGPGANGFVPGLPGTPGTLAANKQVLLIVAGLARHIDETWPGLVESLIVPNEEAGYSFTNFFSTNAALGCHKGSPKWEQRKCEEPTDRESNVEQIKKLFAPRAVTVLDYGGLERSMARLASSTSVCSDSVDDDGDVEDETADLDNGWSWWDRVHHALDNVEPGARFDRVVALRPDVVLGWAPKKGTPPREDPVVLRLDEMCEKKPGLSFVTGSWKWRIDSWFHNRDLDFMQILCPGEKLQVYKEATQATDDICEKETTLPSLPRGFNSTKGWNNHARYCRFVQLFEINKIPVSNWDGDYHLSWLKRFCMSHEGSGCCSDGRNDR